MDPLSQGVLGAAASQAVAKPASLRAFALLGFVSGMAPDMDYLIRSAEDPLLWLEYHRQFSHSLIFIPFGALLSALVTFPLARRWLRFPAAYLACLLGYATHGLLDACTSYGTQLFWPFSDARIAWNSVSVIDPLFSGPLLVLVVAGYAWRKRQLAWLALAWAIVYLGFGALQQARVLAAAEALLLARDQEAVRMLAKPGFANLLLWKVIYEHQGRYHVEAFRAGGAVTWCGGDSVRKLVISRDLPWLDTGSQQAVDLARFQWFSDGYLAMDSEVPDYVVDVRYSSLPNRIDAIWGIRLDRQADGRRHADYQEIPSRRTEQMSELRGLLSGAGCRASAG